MQAVGVRVAMGARVRDTVAVMFVYCGDRDGDCGCDCPL